ncbi:unnamed protein product [Clavelina lepadiformis]|uniref:LAGLIDADG homing endonuclease n=1 Tax=Clavelina lepadiformis TaxID=159417 RepID=A0ABP0EZF1_CLALP
MSRKCKNNPDLFCYICGSFTIKGKQQIITSDIKKMYKLYSGCPLGDQDKQWASHQIYTACSTGLHKRTSSMPFAIPMIWQEPRDHIQDCYFCLVNVKGFSSKTKSKIA